MYFLPNWRKLTSDRLVWEEVKCVLHQWRPRLTKGSSIEQTRLLKTAIHELQKKGSERSRRSVPVNTVHLETRREESTSIQPKITEPLCTAGKVQTGGSGHGSDISPTWRLHELDLQDAYFMVPIHEQHKKYLRLQFQNKIYEFQYLPFGLSSVRELSQDC